MRRCVACRRWIWPWSRFGWITRDLRHFDRFHSPCHPWRTSQLTVPRVIGGTAVADAALRQQVTGDDAIEQQYRDAYGPEPLAPWQAEGR